MRFDLNLLNTAAGRALLGISGAGAGLTPYFTAADAVALAKVVGAAWTDWTPTYSSVTGTLTTVTKTVASYFRYGRAIIAQWDVTITDHGDAGGAFILSYPVLGAYVFCGFGSGRNVTAGTQMQAYIGAAFNIYTQPYNGGSPIATGNRLSGGIIYEAAAS